MGLIKRADDESILDGMLTSEGGKLTGGKLAHAGYIGGGLAAHIALMRRQKRRLIEKLEKKLGKILHKKWYQPFQIV